MAEARPAAGAGAMSPSAPSARTSRSAAPAAISASYLGDGTQPRLAGQSAEYMLQSMLDFRTRKRGNNPGMSDLMRATSEDDLAALAAYLAGL